VTQQSAFSGLEASMVLVQIDTTRIQHGASFQDVFGEAFGFPDFYGRNKAAWIDCMTSLDDPAAGMSRIHSPEAGVVTLQLDVVDTFDERVPSSTGRS
jgi:Barstar (barnase inhibitor)